MRSTAIRPARSWRRPERASRKQGCFASAPPLLQQARGRLVKEELSFGEFLAQHGLSIDANDFQPAGQWLTPPFVPIRFATRYFLYHLRGEQNEGLVEGEIVGLDWLSPTA